MNPKTIDGNKNIEIEPYLATKGEFLTTITINLSIEEGKFPFEQEQNDWFLSRLDGSVEFHGATELEKVGVNLNEFFPSELKQNFYLLFVQH